MAESATLLHGFAARQEVRIFECIAKISAVSPFRHMITPGGFRMSVAMTSCGEVGWITDRTGYRYSASDPETGKPWPAMPALFFELAEQSAQAGGFAGFTPDACLINRYEPGARMSLHQDKDEADFGQPIVSVSLGLPATFLFGGLSRKERPKRYLLQSGDVVVWGGPTRLAYHGVAPLKDGVTALTGAYRFNLTFRRAV